jgi:hypothetical protein
VALGLRLWGIGFGLPDLDHPDEPAYVLQALAVGRGLPDGLTFANPPLFKYLLLVEYAADFGLRRLAGSTRSAQDFVDQFRADPTQLYLIARGTSALVGALTALAAFGLGSAVGGRRAGLIAGWLTAVTYLLARDSHFGVNDALVTLLVTLGLVFCVRVARGGGRADYLLAGVLAGLAFAAKYQGIALLVPLVVAHTLRAATRRRPDLGIGLAGCLVATVLAFPSLVTETGRVLHDIYLHLWLAAVGGYDGLDPAGGYSFYARSLVIGLGWPLLAAAMFGVLLGLKTRNQSMLVVVALPISVLAVLGAQQLYFARFLLPVIPVLVVAAALALDTLIAPLPALGLAALLIATPSLVDVVRFDALLSREDTRALARDWVASSLPAGATLAVDSAPLGPSLSGENAHQVLVADTWSLFDLTPADYRARGVEYLVVSSFTSEVRAVDPERDARRVAFYAALPAEASAVAQFRPFAADREPPFLYDQIYGPFNGLDQLERPGPTVTVYRFNFNAEPGTPP